MKDLHDFPVWELFEKLSLARPGHIKKNKSPLAWLNLFEDFYLVARRTDKAFCQYSRIMAFSHVNLFSIIRAALLTRDSNLLRAHNLPP